MSARRTTELCRITLIAPRVRLDIAVPAEVPLASLLPTLLYHCGEQVREEGAVHGGWALQRLGEAPFDTSRTLAGLGVRDGETLHFRPRQESLPEVVFDDPVDAVATALRERTRRWGGHATRPVALVAAFVLLLAGAAAVLAAGGPWTASAAVCGGVAVALVLAAAAYSRAADDGTGGALLGLAAWPYAFVSGLAALAGHRGLGQLGAAQLAVGFGFALLAAVLAGVAVGPGAAAPSVAGGVAAAAGLVGALVGLRAGGAAAASVAVAGVLALTPLVPRIAYRSAALPPAAVPASVEDLRRTGEPLRGEEVAERALAADRVVTALVAGEGLAVVGGELFLLTLRGWAAATLCGVAAGLLLLRARLFGGLAQRLWLLGAGLVGAVALLVRLAAEGGAAVAAAVLLPLALSAAATAAGWAARPDRRLAPTLPRAADVVELLATVAMTPLVLQLLGVFGWIRRIV